jgi:AcrR family transcriptional regulator
MDDQNNGMSSREKLLSAALSTIDEVGIERATTRRIADRAGVNVQLIQYYFGGKEGLIDEAQVYVVEWFFEHLGSKIKENASLADAVRQGIDAAWKLALDHPQMVQPDLLLQSVRAGREDTSMDRPRQTQVHLLALLEDRVKRSGQKLTMSMDSFMLIMITGLTGLVLEHRVTGDTKRVSGAVADFRDLMVGCVA